MHQTKYFVIISFLQGIVGAHSICYKKSHNFAQITHNWPSSTVSIFFLTLCSGSFRITYYYYYYYYYNNGNSCNIVCLLLLKDHDLVCMNGHQIETVLITFMLTVNRFLKEQRRIIRMRFVLLVGTTRNIFMLFGISTTTRHPV